MPYTPQTWADLPATTTPISAARLGVIESGIQSGTATAEAAVPKSTGTTKGDLFVATSSGVVVRVGVSGTNGNVLTEDSTQTAGIKWAAGSGTTTISLAACRASNPGVGQLPSYTGLYTLDGIALAAGDRVLEKETYPGNGGIYIASTGSWTRAPDMPTGAVFPSGLTVHVTSGNLNANSIYAIRNNNGNATFTVGGSFTGTGDSLAWDTVVPGFGTYQIVTADTNNIFHIGNAGFYSCTIVTNNSIISLADGVTTTGPNVIYLCIQNDAVGGKRFDISPSTVVWDTGYIPSVSSTTVPFDLTAGNTTIIQLTWTGATNGYYYGEILTSIPPFKAVVPTSWTNTDSLGYGGVNTQNVNLNVWFMRYLPSAVQGWYLNALTQCFSAALRQRLLNNNGAFEVGARYCTDGPRSGSYRPGGEAIGGGFFGSSPAGPVASVSSATTAAGAKGGCCHEMCHEMDALYYGGANAHPGAGIGNGSEPDQISSHSAFQGPAGTGIYTDCLNNGGPSEQYEWFAELMRQIRLGDNGNPTSVPPTGSMAVQLGTLTNAGPGSTGGTPAQRWTRFTTYITSLGLV